MNVDEKALIDAARAGDRSAIEGIIACYEARLRAFVHLRLDPRVRAREATVDVVQSVCRELLAAAPAYEFRGVEAFRDWLFKSALNKIRDKQRYHGRERRDGAREQVLSEEFLRAATYLTPSLDAMGRETAEALAAAFEDLSEEYRTVISLARVVELPHAVIAQSMGKSEPAVRQLLVRALLQLSQNLKRRGITME